MSCRILAIVLALISPLAAAANEDLSFERLDREQGLSNGFIRGITQDRAGFLWVATLEGLNRYDGSTFRRFGAIPSDSTSLATSASEGLLIDADGSLWVTTTSGVLHNYSEEFGRFSRFHPRADSISVNQIGGLAADSQGRIWIANRPAGLLYFDPDASRFVRVRSLTKDGQAFRFRFIYRLLVDENDGLWVGTIGQGLLHARLADIENNGTDGSVSLRFERPAASFGEVLKPTDTVWALARDSGGAVYAGLDRGLAFIPSDTATRFPSVLANALANTGVTTVLADRRGVLWIGTGNGLYRFLAEDESLAHYRHEANNPRSLSNSAITALFEDRTGNLWVGTHGSGLCKLNSRAGSFRSDPEPIRGKSVSTVKADTDGTLWLGTWNHGLYRYSPANGTLTVDRATPGDVATTGLDNISDIALGGEGQVWISTMGGGLHQYDRESGWVRVFRRRSGASNSLSSNLLTRMAVHSPEALWVGTFDSGLNLFYPAQDSAVVFTYDPADANSILARGVGGVLVSASGEVWLFTPGGVNRMRADGQTFDRFPLGGEVNTLREDDHGRIWAGAADGLFLFDVAASAFRPVMSEPDLGVRSLAFEGDSVVWAGTNRGICRIQTEPGRVLQFDRNDGLLNLDFNDAAVASGQDGRLYFGGVNGVTHFAPGDIAINTVPPPVVLTAFRVYDRPLSSEQELPFLQEVTLSHADAFFSFEFAALDFTAPGKNQYAYRLEGFDEKWVNTGSRRYGSYTNLDPGDYTLRIRAANNDGIWNDEGAVLRVQITPPFWKQAWFIVLASLLVLGIVGFAYQRRVASMKRDRRAQERFAQRLIQTQEHDRRRIAGELHDSVGQGLLIVKNAVQYCLQRNSLPGEVKAELAEIADVAGQTIAEIREISYGLHPHQLEQLGLRRAVEAMLRTVSGGNGLQVEMDVEDLDTPMPIERSILVFRILQEAANNIIKHAQASEAVLVARAKNGRMKIRVADNGKGVPGPPEQIFSTSQGLGLPGIAERVRILGGTLALRPGQIRGTVLQFSFPIAGRGKETS